MRVNQMVKDETELRSIVIDMAEKRGWLVFRLPAGNYAASSGSSRNRNGVKGYVKGYPDLTLARNGTVLFFELKMDGKEPSSEQLRWSAHLPHWYIIRPADLGDERLERILYQYDS